MSKFYGEGELIPGQRQSEKGEVRQRKSKSKYTVAHF